MRPDLKKRIESIEADISTLALDAIVNAANEPLIMGGGVDGAIRRKAGREMEDDLRRIGRCKTGSAVITKGHRLAARFVIHTVAPVWSSGGACVEDKERMLADCYRNSLSLAAEHDLASMAFPCIGTGVYAWPPDRAAEIALETVLSHLGEHAAPERVIFCCFSADDRARYEEKIAALK
jgi:O-acetyl-ADP-ribose deacetylase (regulator of RNase III)